MIIIPAIDLKDGNVVRLVQGRKNKKVYSDDPVAVAGFWEHEGARLIHIVDLDGAFTGVPKNIEIVKNIASEIKTPLEFGGGVRSWEMIESLIAAGVKRVVLGTKAIENRDFLVRAFKIFKKKIIVSIDVKNGFMLTDGWKKTSREHNVFSFVRDLKKIGFTEVIYTDTLKDGTLTGPNIDGIRELIEKTKIRVVASGGISCLRDIARLKSLDTRNVSGIIIGKALYEHKFSLADAVNIRAQG
ncbi:MAG: 1-(5-phosphoribosyl)-5-[(5-phosphoribosylamino)methylideneamino]imidazole-4-carboxamide isomerase [Candidatus Omnitrophica bacterium]|nr:1-(5-phosphoribosyl)-5-[(5-phosphoribosylamino)methylideneamino]imidazole-4-carboxamide isomerase [Candidatus Omnitrophota bacterium]